MFVASKNGSLAQLGEHLPYKQEVVGSSPTVSTTNFPFAWQTILASLLAVTPTLWGYAGMAQW